MFKKIKNLLAPPTFAEQDEMRDFNVRFLYYTLLIAFFAVTLGFVSLLVFEPQSSTTIILLLFVPVYILIIVGYIFLRRGAVRTTAKLISWGCFVIYLTSSIVSSGVTSNGYFGLVAIVMYSGLALGYRYGILFASMGTIAGLIMLITRGWNISAGGLLVEPAYIYYMMQTSISYISILIIYMVEQRSHRITQALQNRTSELVASQEIYRMFYENAPIGIMRTTPDGRILEANQRSAEILGFGDVDQLKQLNIKGFYLNASDRTIWRERIEQTGWIDRFEFRGRRADGEIIWIELASRLFRKKQDQSIYYESSLQDITTRKKTEERIRFYSQFEKLVTSISTSFISLPAEELESELQSVVERLGRFLAVDRCQVWLFEDQDIKMARQWCAEGVKEVSLTHFADVDEGTKNYIFGRLRAGLVAKIHQMDALPDEAVFVKKLYETTGVKSSLSVPFGYHQATLGWIGLYMVREEREWQDETIRLLKVVGEIVTNALRRRQMESDLQFAQALLQAAIENSPAGILVADAPDVSIRIANKAALTIRGDTQAELKDVSYQQQPENWQCYHKDGRLYSGEELPLTRAILNGEITANKEIIIRRSDGEDRVVLVNAAPVRDANGNIVAGIVVMPDITERVRTTELLEQSEARFRAIVEDQTEMIVRWKPDGTYSFVNNAFCRYLNLDEAEIIHSNIFDHVDAEAKIRMKTNIANASPDAPTWGGVNNGLLPNGTRRWREWTNRGIFDTNGQIVEIQSVGRDVHDRILAEEEINQRLEFESLVASISAQLVNIKPGNYKKSLGRALEMIGNAMTADRVSLWRFDEDGPHLSLIHAWQKDTAEKQRRSSTIRLKGQTWLLGKITQNNPIQIPSVTDLPPEANPVQKNLLEREMLAELMLPVASDGVTIGAISFQYREEQQGWSQIVMGLLQILAEVLLNTVERVNAESALYESEERYRRVLETSPDAIVLTDLDHKIVFCNPQYVEMHGYKSAEEIIEMYIEMLVAPENSKQFLDNLHQPLEADSRVQSQEYVLLREDGSRFIGEVRASPICDAEGDLQGSIIIVRDVTERKKAEAALRSSEMRFHTFMNTLPALAFYKDEAGHYLFANDAYQQLYGFEDFSWQGKTDYELWPERADRIRQTDNQILSSGKPIIAASTTSSVSQDKFWRIFKFPFSDAAGEKYLGAIAIDVTEQKRAEERISRQLLNLEALHTIDQAIAANTELDSTVSILLQQVQSQLHIDAADLLLFEDATQMLILADSIGFHSHLAAPQVTLRVGSGCAGQAILNRRNIQIPDIREGSECVQYVPAAWEKEGFISYFGVPLLAKGMVKGVLELFHRSKFEPDAEWLNFLELLAGQAAIAIDNVTLFKDLQRSNMEMSLAYDTTLEGWAKALELRDRETEGHSRRVTDLTMQLARVIGMSQEELIHVRRGALLHDIGKMGIPDSILHKPGPLTEEEWVVMRQHPVMAYQLLINIPYLRRAIDIPYGHHERWDGSGYPQGLRGTQIPLAARIFAAIDIWDALLSDRPYRKAWPEEKVLAYLKEQAGVQLDPQVVDRFLELLTNGS